MILIELKISYWGVINVEELREILNYLYDKFGYNEAVAHVSKLLDEYIVEEQRGKLKKRGIENEKHSYWFYLCK